MTISFVPSIAPEILVQHPDFHLVSIVLRDAVVTTASSQELEDLVLAAEASAVQDDAIRNTHLYAWAEVYKGFGAKPNKTPCSATALIRRVQKDGVLPRISPLVDAYNAISVIYGIPVGGEDLDRYHGSPRLMTASGTEEFETVHQGELVIDHPAAGEIVWCDGLGVTCRRWNWRQGRRTMVTADSSALWLVLEALAPISAEMLNAAASRLATVIATFCPDALIVTDYLNGATIQKCRSV